MEEGRAYKALIAQNTWYAMAFCGGKSAADNNW